MIIAMDIEANSLDFWREDFIIKSIALAWLDDCNRLITKFYDDPDHIEAAIKRVQNEMVLVYNASYDIGVIRAKYPQYEPKDWVDVMRLRQVRSPVDKKVGYGLKAATAEFLPGMAGYEKKYYEHLKTQFPDVPAKKLGQHLGDLPRDLLAEYNTQDAIATLKLYDIFTKYFENEIDYNWKKDHILYRERVSAVIEGKLLGMKINRQGMQAFIESVDAEVKEMDIAFFEKFKKEILISREILQILDLYGKKSLPGKKRVQNVLSKPPPEFNTGSALHLEVLFCFCLGIEPPFKTPKGNASLKAAHLSFYGQGGKMLDKRKKRLIVQSQAIAALGLSENDGRYHPDLKTCGTKTGRLSGGQES